VIVPPGAEPHYTEKIVRVPGSYQPNDTRRPHPDAAPSREALGLPATGVVLCCFNNSYKITPTVFDVWMRLLHAVPGSVFWLLHDNERTTRNLRREAARRGVDERRLVFAPRAPATEHLARHLHADLFLDTLPYNAHTTTSDALWMGVPVLTCLGDTFAGRVAASLLLAMDLPDLVTRSLAEYESLACALALDAGRLRSLKDRVAAHRTTSSLFRPAALARHLEAAYAAMIARHRAGLPPDHITVAG
jgi:predicted O-linked N-acetylglucosamine transferase (SPINDLY family)